MDAMLYERDRLDIGATIAGPALVEQFDATTVIPPGWAGHVDGYGNLILVWRFRSPHHSGGESETRTSEPKPHLD